MMMAITVVKALGLENVTLHINSLGDEESRDAYRKALQDHFRPVLSDLCEDCNARFEKNPLRILDCKVDAKHEAMKTAPKTIDYLSESAKAHFDKVCALLDDLEVLAKVLESKNMDLEDYHALINPKLTYHDFSLFSEGEMAVERIREAIDQHEKICIYGDYDCDGILATAIMVQAFHELNVKVGYHIPNRFEDGYE